MERNDFLNLKPMLLEEVSNPFDDDNYIYELKFDGIRTMILIDNGNITIKSRNGIILNDIYPELDSIKNMSKETCIFDGEIVLLEEGKPSFSKVMERFKLKDKIKISRMQNEYPVTFVCFDILYKNKDLTNLSLIERKRILSKFNDTDVFIKTKYIVQDGINYFNEIKKMNLEGIVAKRKDSKYYYGIRTKDWVKIKNYIEEEFFICGYDFNKNNTIGIILGEKRENKFYYVGKIIMGDKNKLFNKLIKIKKVNNFLINYEKKESKYIYPKHKLVVNYIERTKDNMLREAFIKK